MLLGYSRLFCGYFFGLFWCYGDAMKEYIDIDGDRDWLIENKFIFNEEQLIEFNERVNELLCWDYVMCGFSEDDTRVIASKELF